MRLPLLPLLILLAPVSTQAQSAADSSSIRTAALNYAEGWYAGDAARMTRALHPDLAKRIVRTDSAGVSHLGSMTATQLIEGTGKGFGRNTPSERQLKRVEILSMTGGAASVKLTMSDWVDYLHVARWNGEWRIVNVLWEMTRN